MKNLRKAELAVIGLTILCLVFTAGYFIGKSSGTSVITFNAPPASSAPLPASAPVSASAPSGASPAPYFDTALPYIDTAPPDTDTAPPDDGQALTPADSPAATDSGGTAVSGRVNINTATLSELDALPGIGKVIAQSIIDYREKVGGFKTIEQIKDVDGIGDKKFEAMKDIITVG
jgi:competence protein ComEA